MSASLLVILVTGLVAWAVIAAPRSAHADGKVDHQKTRFPLVGRHQKVSCESCHPPSGATRKWKGVPLDCRGCHGDRKNHKGALGAQCERCHEPSSWRAISHPASKHRFPLTGNHRLDCVACHGGGKRLVEKIGGCVDCHQQPHVGTQAACETCHAVRDWKAVTYKHAVDLRPLGPQHAKATCLGCHPQYKFARTTFDCESCHRKDQPHESLGPCQSCHGAQGWATLTLFRGKGDKASPPGRYSVAWAFDHLAHGRKVVAARRRATCAPCHTAFDGVVPRGRPTMRSCEGCHDGKTAFDTLGTSCARCHREPRATAPAAPPPADARAPSRTSSRPFRHASHEALKTKLECVACHQVNAAARPAVLLGDKHRPCAPCHAEEFRSAGSEICLLCHESNEPFAPSPLRAQRTQRPEWRSGPVPHRPHLDAKMSCQTCHPAQAGLVEATGGGEARGHALCGQCHAAQAKGALALTRCDACHVRPAVTPARERRAFSTRDTFRHDGAHTARPCADCHAPDASGRPTAPEMASCGACHDGKTSFALYGIGCARCHSRAPAAASPRKTATQLAPTAHEENRP